MTNEDMKEWIDKASYLELLRRWRFAPAGDPFFQVPIGSYYSKVMAEKKAALGPGEAVAASKAVGL